MQTNKRCRHDIDCQSDIRHLLGKNAASRTHLNIRGFNSQVQLPLFLLSVFAKNEKANLSKSERNQLATLATTLIDTFGVQNV